MRQNHERTGGLPNLRLVVVGLLDSGNNTAEVLAANGAPLLSQSKLARWTLSAPEVGRYGLDAGLVDRSEEIPGGVEIALLDCPGIGRLAFLICEDLVSSDPARRTVVDVAPNIVCSPVMDASLADTRWAYGAAIALAQEPAALVLVCNSWLLHMKQVSAGTAVVCPVGIGIVCHPDEHDQTAVLPMSPTAAGYEHRTVRWSRWA
jgi:predicted amidohydrolase